VGWKCSGTCAGNVAWGCMWMMIILTFVPAGRGTGSHSRAQFAVAAFVSLVIVFAIETIQLPSHPARWSAGSTRGRAPPVRAIRPHLEDRSGTERGSRFWMVPTSCRSAPPAAHPTRRFVCHAAEHPPMGACGILETRQGPDEGEARFLANVVSRLGIAGQACRVPSHVGQPAPQKRLEGGGVPRLCPEVAPERRRFEIVLPLGGGALWPREALRLPVNGRLRPSDRRLPR